MSIFTASKSVSASISAKSVSRKHWKAVREQEIWSSLEEDCLPLLEVRYHDYGVNREANKITETIIRAALKGQPVILPKELREQDSFFHRFNFLKFIEEVNYLRMSGEIPAFLEVDDTLVEKITNAMRYGGSEVRNLLIPSQNNDEDEEVFIKKEEKTFSPLGYSSGDLVLQRCVPEALDELNSKPMFGLELESDFGPTSSNVSGYINILNYGVLAHDSSTDIEFVSAPMSIDTMLMVLSSNKSSFDNYLMDNHRNTTGMHVHYSRCGLKKVSHYRPHIKKNLRSTHLGRLLMFMNRYENRNYIEQVAGRQANEYCEFDLPDSLLDVPNHDRKPDRYLVLNTKNSDTIEFRIFKSPNNVRDVIKNLEWVRDVIEYTRSNDNTHYKAFLAWRVKQSPPDISLK